jgi:GTP-binding protein YchF
MSLHNVCAIPENVVGFNCGIIGLPNVGKSTIFNALASAEAEMANYPFCTIEPNRGIVPVPDPRLEHIATLLQKNDPIQTRIEFIDVAGLVRGASKGEGLGNKFLGHIRDVDAVVHVVRCFRASDVVHVSDEVDPVGDVEIVRTELMLADLEVLEKAHAKLITKARSGDKGAKARISIIDNCIAHLNSGQLIKTLELASDARVLLAEYGLITFKPVLYCANVDEENSQRDLVQELEKYAEKEHSSCISITGKLEEEISELPPEEKQDFLQGMGLEESGLDRLIHSSYTLLDLITYYTAATQLQAWTLRRGTRAVDAAGKIHTDFARGFIRAEVYGYDDLVNAGSEHDVKESGRLRSEGKDYVICEGDIVHFLFNL